MSVVLSTIPSPSLSHANHADRQGPGLSYYANNVDQLTHRRQLQLVTAVIRVCFFHLKFSHPLTPTTPIRHWHRLNWCHVINSFLSYADHGDRQGPGLSYYADYGNQLNH